MTSLTDTQVITASGGLVELGYSQRTTDVAVPVTAATSPTTVISDMTVVCDGGPVLVEFFAPIARPGTAAGNIIYINLYQDGAELDRGFAYIETPVAGFSWHPVHLARRVIPTAGSHTFSIRAYAVGNAGQINAGSGGTGFSPAFLRVSKIVQATQWPAVTTGTIICTSSTRPSAPFEGQQIYETDTDQILVWSGSAWVPAAPQFSTLVGRTSRTAGSIGLATTLAGTGNLMSSNLTFTADGSTTYKVVVTAPRINSPSTASTSTDIHLTNGSNTSLGVVASMWSETTTRTYAPLYAVVYLTPSAGTVTYNVSGTGGTGSGFASGAGGGSTFVPANLEVYR